MSFLCSPGLKLGAVQKITFDGTNKQSTAVGANTRAVLLSVVTSACKVAIGAPSLNSGSGPDATQAAAGFPLQPGMPPFALRCSPGDKVAVTQLSAGGDLYISEVAG